METETKQPTEESVLQDVANTPKPVKAFGREYEIKKFNVGQIAHAMGYITPIRFVFSELIKPQADVVNILLGAVQMCGEDAIGLVSVATYEPIEWIAEQENEIEFLDLFTTVIEKNAPLFSPENIARVKEMLERLQSKIPALGGLTSTP
jgi:hypothetical protein